MGSRRHQALAESQGVCTRRAATGAPVALAALLLLAGTWQLFLAGDAAATPSTPLALDGHLEVCRVVGVWQCSRQHMPPAHAKLPPAHAPP